MKESRINRFLKIEEDDSKESSRLHLQMRPEFENEVGITHGGMVALLVDGAMGRTVMRSMAQGESAATIQLSLQYLKPAQGKITAEAKIVRKGRKVLFVEGRCFDEKGQIVATAHGVWSVLQKT